MRTHSTRSYSIIHCSNTVWSIYSLFFAWDLHTGLGSRAVINVCNGQPRCEGEPLFKTLVRFNRILYRLSWPQCGQDLQRIDILQVYTHALIRQRLGLSIRRVDTFSAHVKVPRPSTELQSRPLEHIRSLPALAKPQDIAERRLRPAPWSSHCLATQIGTTQILA